MSTKSLYRVIRFLLLARTKTYAGNIGRVKGLLEESKQYEYKEGNLMYRDIYNQGSKKFVGIETIYLKTTPVWSMSYYGNFEKMSENEADRILRKSLIDNWEQVRTWEKVVSITGDYKYTCDGEGGMTEFNGREKITKNGKTVYFLYYAAGSLVE